MLVILVWKIIHILIVGRVVLMSPVLVRFSVSWHLIYIVEE